MNITLKTPYGDMNFNMPQDRVTALIQQAFLYAESEPEENAPLNPPIRAQERPNPVKVENRPRKRVESLFGDFRASEQEQHNEQPGGEPEEYKGFLLIKCDHCGKLKGFCAKTPIREYRCECGGKTALHGLKPAYLNCKCGSSYKYKTNVTDERFDYNCLQCGGPIDL